MVEEEQGRRKTRNPCEAEGIGYAMERWSGMIIYKEADDCRPLDAY